MASCKRVWAGAALGGVLLWGSGCGRAEAVPAGGEGGEPPWVQRGAELFLPERSPLRARVSVARVELQPLRRELEVPATVEADPARVARISPPLPGRVVALQVRLGEPVRKGQPLFTLDSPDLVAAQADLLKARAAAAQAARNLERQRDLRDHGGAAEKELEQARADAEGARSELARGSARLRLLGMAPGEVGGALVVRAPLPGRVIDLATAPGQFQSDPAAVLLVVADLSTLWVTASLQEKDLARVQVGDEALVELAAYPGERLPGRVRSIGEVLAPDTRTVKVRLELPNPEGRLKPGMFARVALRGRPAPGLAVPPAAVRLSGEQSYLYVERAPWTFERRSVEVGEALPQGLAVTRGLAAGERVITSNTILLP